MGSRKHIAAEARKEQRKGLVVAKLRNNPTSPRKTRLMADVVRGLDVNEALGVLQYSQRESAEKIRKLILSAVANWQVKNEGRRVEDARLYIHEIWVDGGSQMKRLRSTAHGRGVQIRKKSNHITVVLGDRSEEQRKESTQISE